MIDCYEYLGFQRCPACWGADWHVETSGDMTCTECGTVVNYWESINNQMFHAMRERSRIEDGALN